MRVLPALLLPLLAACPRPAAPQDPIREAWTALLRHRPDRPAADPAAARAEIDFLQARLAKDPAAAADAGEALLRTSKDGVERLMIALYLRVLDRPRGEPLLAEAAGALEDVDPVFPTIYGLAREWAATRQERFLPGILAVFKTRRGRIKLPDGDAHVETPECMAYVALAWGPELLPRLRPLLGSADPFVRRNAAFALGLLFDDPSRPALKELLKDKGPAAGGAAFALGELGVRETGPALAALLADPLPENRFWAAAALYELRAVDVLPRLREALEREKDEDVRGELENVVAYLAAGAPPYGTSALKPAELAAALAEAEKMKGYDTGRAREIAASAGRNDLPALERIRAASTEIPTARGPGCFRVWGAAIKEARRRP